MKRTFWFSLAAFLSAGLVPAQVSPDINPTASREFGQDFLNLGIQTNAPNLLEGRELNSPSAFAFDTSVSPPILYVVDTSNHRVLAFRNPANLTAGNTADRVIGQRDFYSAFAGGPSTNGGLVSSGMSLPNGAVVDASGNLYVLDAGNNRILRFPQPMQQTSDFVSPDLVIGQKTPGTGNLSNEGLAQPTAKTLSFNRSGGVARGGLAFDAQGNLWVADTLNNRVLRFPKSALTASEPTADTVLGHATFDTDAATTVTQSDALSILHPTAVAVDANGGVYVADAYLRVLYFSAQSNGAAATRILGIQPTPTSGQPTPVAPTQYTLGQVGTLNIVPQCVFTLGNVLFVCDNAANRIVRFGSPDTWPVATNGLLSPPAVAVYGQANFTDSTINRGGGASLPGNNTFYAPTFGAVFNNELWVADTGNNRVISLQQDTTAFNFTVGDRLVGQLGYDLNAPNLIEGRELFINGANYQGSGIVVDRSSTPNHLYIADSLNNRILGFNDIRKVGTDARTLLTTTADIIIGQVDRFHSVVNYPNNDPLIPGDQGLFLPSGLALDAFGNLWVADTGNARVLRFPAPFAQPAGPPHANLVLGQSNFTIKITDASSSTMAAPYGVVVFNNGDVGAGDIAQNRVLLWHKTGADFTNGQSARAVLGQQTFSATGTSGSAAGLNSPRGMAVDSNDRLYVADTGNSRLVVYGNTGATVNGASGTAIPNVGQPSAVAISSLTGEIWVAASNNNAVYRFPEFSKLPSNAQPTATVFGAGPIAVGLDAFDNVVVGELANRMTFFYAAAVYRNAASYASGTAFNATLSPNQFTLIARSGKDFAFTPVTNTIPYAKSAGGYQVIFNGIPAPITSVTTNAIYFIVPNGAPSSGAVDVQVIVQSTGEILAAGNFSIGIATPGFFTTAQNGLGPIAAINPDNTVNTTVNRVGQGQTISLFLTGYGHIDGLVDGAPSAGAVSTPELPQVYIGGLNAVVGYSGVAPQYPGLWQINVRIPATGDTGGGVPPGLASVVVISHDVPSNIVGAPGQPPGTDQKLTGSALQTIFVK